MFKTQFRLLPQMASTMPRADIAATFYQLSRYLSAGVPLIEALADVSAVSAGRSRQQLWARIGHCVESGQSLSQALSECGVKVEKTVIAIIRSGEENGKLGSACESVSEYLQWHLKLRQRLITLLVYPLFSLTVLFVVVGFLFISVVPSIDVFLQSTGDALNWYTLALLGFSKWINSSYLMLLSVLLGLLFCLFLLLAFSSSARRLIDRCILKLPLLGPVLVDLLLSRYARCCAQLYGNGIALEVSLQLAEETIANYALRADLASVRLKTVSGKSLADAMQPIAILPPLFKRLVGVGEKSGQLPVVLNQIAQQQSEAAQASIDRVEQLIGPVILLCVGTVLLWIVMAMLVPVYNMAIITLVGAP